jgi:hypothetical protein
MTVESSLRPSAVSPDPVEWRELSRDLWAGRREGRHIGTVERGHRYLATGADSERLGAYRTLAAAMDAVAQPDARPVDVPPAPRSRSGLLFVAAVSTSAAMLMAVYVFLIL